MPTTRRAFFTGRFQHPSGVTISDACLPRMFVHCQSCGDICPQQAIRFIARRGGPPLPHIVAAQCTGCGDCLSACPCNALILGSDFAHV